MYVGLYVGYLLTDLNEQYTNLDTQSISNQHATIDCINNSVHAGATTVSSEVREVQLIQGLSHRFLI